MSIQQSSHDGLSELRNKMPIACSVEQRKHIFFLTFMKNNKSETSFLHNVCKFKHCNHKFIKSFTKTNIASIEEKNVKTGKISAKMQNYFPLQMSWMMLMEPCTLSISEIVSHRVALQSWVYGSVCQWTHRKEPHGMKQMLLKRVARNKTMMTPPQVKPYPPELCLITFRPRHPHKNRSLETYFYY